MSITIYGNTVGTPTSPKKIEEFVKPVKTVNGQAPDKKGNVEIAISNGGIVNDSAEKCAEFLRNIKVNYFWDENSNTNYSLVRVFKKRVDGTFQYPFVYVPNGAGSPIESALDCALNHGWYLTINAGCGGTYGSPNGTLIQGGVVIQQGPTAQHPTAMPLTINTNGDLGHASAHTNAETMVNSGIVSAVCGFMPIIKEYEPVPESEWITGINHFNTGAQRQIIGQFWNGDYAIITCEGRNNGNSVGFTIAQAQAVCKKHGLKFAYNLDGGGSTGTVINKKQINTIYEGTTGRKVPAFIVFNGGTIAPEADAPDEPDIPDIPDEPVEPDNPNVPDSSALIWVFGSTDSDKVTFGGTTNRITAYAQQGTREMVTVTDGNAGITCYDFRGGLYLAEIPNGAASLNIPNHESGDILFSATLYDENFTKLHNSGYIASVNITLGDYPSAKYYSINCKHTSGNAAGLIAQFEAINALYTNVLM